MIGEGQPKQARRTCSISGTRSLTVMLTIQRCGMTLAQQTLSG